MRLAAAPRWAISFADLALLLLGCFVMLHAMRPPTSAPTAAATIDAALVADLQADLLFEPGEARLTAAGAARLRALAEGQSGRPLQLASRGGTQSGARLDAFELAAARAAAVARVLGIDGRYVTVQPRPDAEAGQSISLFHIPAGTPAA
ncbi:flagellar motor protein MotB [Sphingosinicella terrae]|uniref:flagellar motor protein MotB n=1 Tax=Sphingosinicella terrae TaxID=2172047 RepID=UPI000E0DC29B|nr:flagellar motor protein MotB [Sphingosinicella terrae]